MRALFDWAANAFDSFNIFLPDAPIVYTLEALGYSHQKSVRKVDKQIRYLRNKIYRALDLTRIPPRDTTSLLLDFGELSIDPFYQKEFRKVRFCFENDSRFRRDCLDTSAQVLGFKIQGKIEMDQKLKAVKYLLAEIPIISATSEICGANSSVFCYHQSVPLFTNLFAGVYDYRVSPKQAYLIVNEDP